MKIQPVIMSGGSGTRLWPLSRRARPKQFLALTTKCSLFQDTVSRLSDGGDRFAAPLIIAGKGHAGLIDEQLAETGASASDVVLEPCARNTAAVAAVAALWTAKNNPGALTFLSPADHYIADKKTFRDAVVSGADAAAKGYIVTFGIKPAHPHTGYGYIQSGEEISAGVYRVNAFKEKPDAATAQRYLSEGGYFWNGGLFLFSAEAMIEEFARLNPETLRAAKSALDNATAAGKARLLDEGAFTACPSISVDYAIMEKTANAAVIPDVEVGWNDIGSWSEVTGDADTAHLIHDSRNLLIRSDGPMVGAVGVENLIIIATGDAILVARRDKAQEVRTLVEELKKRGREDLL